MKNEWKSCLKWGVCFFLVYLGITYWPSFTKFVQLIFDAAFPLIIGGVIAYVANILVSCYERHYFPKSTNRMCIKSRRPVCMAGAFLTVIIVFVVIILIVIPQVAECVQVLLEDVPVIMNRLIDYIGKNELLSEETMKMLKDFNWQTKLEQIIRVVTSGIGNVMSAVMSTVSSVVSWVVSGIMSLVFAIYLLSGKERLGKQMKKLANRYLKKGAVDKVFHIVAVFNDSFHRFIVGQCVEAVILGTLCALGMKILRIPYAVMIGALTMVTALIPIVGAWISGIVGAIMILTVSPVKAVIFIVYIVALQQIEGNLIYPRVVGSSIGLPGIWVFTAVTIGGSVLGIGGMFISVPLASACYKLLQADVNRPPKYGKMDTKNDTIRKV